MSLTRRLTRRLPSSAPAANGERHYRDAVGWLWSQLVAATLDESVPAAGSGHARWPAGPAVVASHVDQP